ncbi:hypothetical protein [Amycolatopsis sp. WAC 01416]|uniref:hypothetical protein n=1 Tax=Amycolatopsis sp. WAC 01416 TaxID=2203196 RepID=UPI000F7B8CAE|nr:hypothetical protein [Amycolatopsis sp. WAC 01416]
MIKIARRPVLLGAATVAFSALLTAMPASATTETSESSQGVHTDVSSPTKTFTTTGKDVPVGAWQDRGFHASKAYFTFDLRPYRGAVVGHAEAYATETAANDCAKPRATEMWVTDPATAPTWLRQPKERVKLPGPGAPAGCLSDRVEWDAAQAVSAALAAGAESVTFTLRMPDDRRFDPSYGRRVANRLQLHLDYNRPPSAPANLMVGHRPCGTDPVYTPDNPVQITGVVDDPDRSPVAAKVTIWPVDDPANRRELGPDSATTAPHHALFRLPADFVTDGRVYQWTMQGVDSVDSGLTGPASAPCSFIADRVAPSTGPVVTSTDYPNDGAPHGFVGVPGKFTIDAKGDQDVIGFATGNGYVPADRPGGVATVQYTPAEPFDAFRVWPVDRASNFGPGTHYGFSARSSKPGVRFDVVDVNAGEPVRLDFTPGAMPGVVEYVYNFGAAGDVVVPAGPDGAATVTVTPARPWASLTVSGRTREGWTSERWDGMVELGNGTPTVSSSTYPADRPGGGVGVPGDFTFTSTRPGVTGFVYTVDYGEAVPVLAQNGTATISLTPDKAGYHNIEVTSTNADGSASTPRRHVFIVNG